MRHSKGFVTPTVSKQRSPSAPSVRPRRLCRATMVKPHSPPIHHSGAALERSTLMTDGEFEDFWESMARRRLLVAGEAAYNAAAESAAAARSEEAAHRGRPNKPTHQRCGTCRGCAANDCGNCKNCRDKPRCADTHPMDWPACTLP